LGRGSRLQCEAASPVAGLRTLVAAAAVAAMLASAHAQAPASPVAYEVVGDAIPRPLTDTPGDAVRGRAIVANRQVGLCLLCHAGPFPEERFQGTLAPSLAGSGTRWTEGQLRLRVVDNKHVNPGTVMPSFYRVDGLARVGAAWNGRTVLTAQQVEDVVALLGTLRD
jgi:L-cysteine S-thiosulfotransferase